MSIGYAIGGFMILEYWSESWVVNRDMKNNEFALKILWSGSVVIPSSINRVYSYVVLTYRCWRVW